eukprot:jgi/Chlat1/2151/Chrsp17S02846
MLTVWAAPVLAASAGGCKPTCRRLGAVYTGGRRRWKQLAKESLVRAEARQLLSTSTGNYSAHMRYNYDMHVAQPMSMMLLWTKATR